MMDGRMNGHTAFAVTDGSRNANGNRVHKPITRDKNESLPGQPKAQLYRHTNGKMVSRPSEYT